ncbi:MAG: nucleotidyltransferase domain-containing protein, partial [Chloroflexi bacterium]|nr:nucleotidyltransferase domain-containing protein [Chloroflexota bacterium]
MDVEQLTQQLQEFSKTSQDIAAIYLFGSQAKNSARPDSDVDI